MKISLTNKGGKKPEKNGLVINYASPKRAFPWIRWYFVLLLVTSPLLYFIYNMTHNFIVIDSPVAVWVERAVVSMPRAGVIETLSADVAMRVAKGEPVMKVLPEAWKTDWHSIELLQERARNFDNARSIEKVRVSPAKIPDGSVRQAAASLAYWSENRQAYEDLRKKGAATEAEYREAVERENAARNALAQLQLQLVSLGAAAVVDAPENIGLLLERMQIDKEIALLRERIAGEVVVSPISGVISEIRANAGQTLPLGETVLEIINEENATILAYAGEEAWEYVSLNASVNVEFPGKLTVPCKLAAMPLQTRPIPDHLAGLFPQSQRAVLVELEPMMPLPSAYRVDGLPGKVHWGLWKPETESAVSAFLSLKETLADFFRDWLP